MRKSPHLKNSKSDVHLHGNGRCERALTIASTDTKTFVKPSRQQKASELQHNTFHRVMYDPKSVNNVS